MCEELVLVGMFLVMCLTFIVVFLGPLWFLDRSGRRFRDGG